MASGYDALGFYNDPDDNRLIVPKRNRALGWTINLGHPYGSLALLVTLAAAVVPLAVGFAVGSYLHR